MDSLEPRGRSALLYCRTQNSHPISKTFDQVDIQWFSQLGGRCKIKNVIYFLSPGQSNQKIHKMSFCCLNQHFIRAILSLNLFNFPAVGTLRDG